VTTGRTPGALPVLRSLRDLADLVERRPGLFGADNEPLGRRREVVAVIDDEVLDEADALVRSRIE
jgi:hypothetical protein